MYLISPSKVLKMAIHWDWDFVRDFFSHVVIYKSPNNLSRSIYQSKMHLTFTPKGALTLGHLAVAVFTPNRAQLAPLFSGLHSH